MSLHDMLAGASNLLGAARAAGINLWLSDGRLIIQGAEAALSVWSEKLRENSEYIIAILVQHENRLIDSNQPLNQNDMYLKLTEAWEEKAAVLEYDGGLKTEKAESEAWKMIFCRNCKNGQRQLPCSIMVTSPKKCDFWTSP